MLPSLIDRSMLRCNIMPETFRYAESHEYCLRRSMMYQLYQAQADLLFPLRQFARLGAVLARLAIRHMHSVAAAAFRRPA